MKLELQINPSAKTNFTAARSVIGHRISINGNQQFPETVSNGNLGFIENLSFLSGHYNYTMLNYDELKSISEKEENHPAVNWERF